MNRLLCCSILMKWLYVLLFLLACRASPVTPASGAFGVGAAAPLRVAILVDVSGSMESAGVNRITPDQLEELTGYCERHAGTIVFGLVTERPEPFSRAMFEALLPLPDTGEASNVNIFLKDKIEKEALARKASIQQYNAEREARNADRASQFMASCSRQLARSSANATDLVDALTRAQVVFRESSPVSTTDILLLISDGIDTTNRTINLDFPSNVRIFVVNSNQELGILSQLVDRVRLYESPDSAVRAILAQAKGGSHD